KPKDEGPKPAKSHVSLDPQDDVMVLDRLAKIDSKKNAKEQGPKPAELHVALEQDGNVMILVEAAEMAQAQPGGKDKGKGPPKTGKEPKTGILQFPRGSFEIIAVPGTRGVIIRASNLQDLEALKKIVAQLSEGGQEIKIVELRHADATSVATTLNQLYSQM